MFEAYLTSFGYTIGIINAVVIGLIAFLITMKLFKK